MYQKPRIRINTFGKLAFPQYIWKLPNNKNKIYLTFDDGPIPGPTEWVLDILKRYNIPATFFCVGDNIRKHPSIYKRIIDEGHSVGNHSFNHVNGWKCTRAEYEENVEKAEGYIKSTLFRPPYGKIRPRVARQLRHRYKIIMWDVLSRDYDQSLTGKECAKIVLQSTVSGSIIVFHDSVKSEANLKTALPIVIEKLLAKGFTFEKIPS